MKIISLYNRDEDNGFTDESPTWIAKIKISFRHFKSFPNKSTKLNIFIKAFSKFRAENVVNDFFANNKSKFNHEYKILSLELI